MRTADLVTASVLMLVAGVVLFDAVRLGVGWGTDGPRSGFFPFWLALFMLAACVGIFVQALRTPSTKPFATRAQLAPVLKVLIPATGLVVVMQFVGLYVASALYIAVYMRWIGRHRWLTVLVIAVGIPKGPLEAWLGY
jgi:putative tricarboxylic transport membrane protein